MRESNYGPLGRITPRDYTDQAGQITAHGDEDCPVKGVAPHVGKQFECHVDVNQFLIIARPPRATVRTPSPPTCMSPAMYA